MNIVVFGPPLSGKGTLSKNLMNAHGFDGISTGALLRQEIQSQSDLGRKIEPILDQGGLIDVDDVIEIISNAYAQRQSQVGVIFDGSPRRVSELYMLLDVIRADNTHAGIDKIIVLDVPEDILFCRMHQRRQEMMARGESPRSDDNESVLKGRLAKYHAETFPVIEEAEKLGIDIIRIYGDRAPDLVQEDVEYLLGLDDNFDYAPSLF